MDDPPVIPNVVREQCVSRMFNISSYSLGKLKDIVSTNSEVQNLTRIEVATALVHKCGMSVSMANSGLFRPSLVTHLMNLHPHFPLNTIGNAYCFLNSATTTEDEIQLPHIVAQLRKAKQHQRNMLKDMSSDKIALHALESINAGVNIIIEKKYDPYMYSSLCNLGLYKIDFGWGKPINVTLARSPMKNNIVFLDNPSGEGINTLITLREADMLIFQSNKELLEFAYPVVYSPE
nr:acylsugar acyltransferase 3-like [Nicotiana tomentosiformis]